MDQHRRQWFFTCWGRYHWAWVGHGYCTKDISICERTRYACIAHLDPKASEQGEEKVHGWTCVFDAGKNFTTECSSWITLHRSYYIDSAEKVSTSSTSVDVYATPSYSASSRLH